MKAGSEGIDMIKIYILNFLSKCEISSRTESEKVAGVGGEKDKTMLCVHMNLPK